MSAPIDDGGPAFPQPAEMSGKWADPKTCKQWVPLRGMSLRDWFAGQAPVTMGDAARVCGWPPEFNLTQDSDRAAFWAVMAMLRFEYADAMIVARRIKGDDNA